MKNLTFMILFVGSVFMSMETVQAQWLRRHITQKMYGPKTAIFNGQDLSGWTTVSGNKDIKGWVVEDGVIHREGRGGDIVTERIYKDFVLDFKWKIVKGGNSGIKYKFNNFHGDWLGCEFQVLDDPNNQEGSIEKHRTGDLYDLFSAKVSKNLLPHDQFNHGRIVVNGRNIQHWLNGELVLNVYVGSPEWEKAFARSKFHDHKQFGKIATGKIHIQDHGDEVWFKDITIREIKTLQIKKHGFVSQMMSKRRR